MQPKFKLGQIVAAKLTDFEDKGAFFGEITGVYKGGPKKETLIYDVSNHGVVNKIFEENVLYVLAKCALRKSKVEEAKNE